MRNAYVFLKILIQKSSGSKPASQQGGQQAPIWIQVADYRGFKKPYKTSRKSIILMFWEVFWEAQNMEKYKKSLDVCKKSRTHKSSFRELFGASKR